MSRSVDIKSQLWAKRFRDFEASSLSVDQFCQSVGCSSPTFYHWKRKLCGTIYRAKSGQSSPNAGASMPKGGQTAAAQSAFLQVQTKSDCSIQIRLLSGVVITIPVDAIDWLPLVLDRVA